jgi:hypothetical protein
MPDQGPDGARRGYPAPICRAAPTRVAGPGGAAGLSRRWLIVIVTVIAALLAGAAVALAATSSGRGPAAPAPGATATAAPGAGPSSGLSDP